MRFANSNNIIKLAICGCLLPVATLLIQGCNSEPPIYPVSGKVTLGGKPQSQLLVYFRSVNDRTSKANLGVGTTDVDGNYIVKSGQGEGIAAGNYRISFSCMQTPEGETAAANEKLDETTDNGAVEAVPTPYNEGINLGTSPVEFEVGSNDENTFDFDIPLK